MARMPRLVLPGLPHLVVQRALAGRPAFVDADDRATYFGALREGVAAEGVQLHAYALTAQEVRLVLTPPSGAALARLMQHLGRRYVSAYNRRHGGQGTLWAGRFGCAALEPGDACLDAMLWVDGASDEPVATSAARHVGARADPLLSDPPAYWALGNTPFDREGAFRERLAAGLPAARSDELRRAVLGGWVVGSPAFAAEAGSAVGRPARPRPRGRPRRPASA
ncbi:MAG: transposase [Rubrivivax sp.]|nr:transposase [Rubrivivax sp.]